MYNNHADSFDHDLQAAGSCQHGSDEYEPTPDTQIVASYYRYIDQGAVNGHDVRDWLETERQLHEDCLLDRRVF